MPGHAKIVSVITAPVSTAPNWRPMSVTTGIRLFRNACRRTARLWEAPRARAACTYGSRSSSSNEARVLIPDAQLDVLAQPRTDLPELFIVAEVAGNTSDQVEVERTDFAKCGRCWRHLPEVQEDEGLCGRCGEMVNG